MCSEPALTAYKIAFGLRYLVWLGGGLAILRSRRLARRELIEQGTVIGPLSVAVRGRSAPRTTPPD